MRGALGEDPVDRCVEIVKDGDYETNSGRREVAKKAAGCGADAACAAYSHGAIPPGICGPIGEKIAEWAIGAWEDVFGDGKREKQIAERFAAQEQSNKTENAMAALKAYDMLRDAAVLKTMTAMIALWDSAVPGERGKLGGGDLIPVVWNPTFVLSDFDYNKRFGGSSTVGSVGATERNATSSQGLHLMQFFDEALSFEVFEYWIPAFYLLTQLGADIELCYTGNGTPTVICGQYQRLGENSNPEVALELVQGKFRLWMADFQTVAAKAQMFVTDAAISEQTKQIVATNQKQLIAAQLIGAQKSQFMNRALFGTGAVALLGAWYVSRRKGR